LPGGNFTPLSNFRLSASVRENIYPPYACPSVFVVGVAVLLANLHGGLVRFLSDGTPSQLGCDTNPYLFNGSADKRDLLKLLISSSLHFYLKMSEPRKSISSNLQYYSQTSSYRMKNCIGFSNFKQPNRIFPFNEPIHVWIYFYRASTP
jgi:hypothetical protein